jgi:hypothetical protein
LVAWCQIPAVMSLLTKHTAGHHDGATSAAPGPRGHLYSWVLAIDEDVAFNSAASLPTFLTHQATHQALARASGAAGHVTQTCRGVCQPLGSVDLADSVFKQSLRPGRPRPLCSAHWSRIRKTPCGQDCAEDGVTSEDTPCLVVAKEIAGWPGVNVGSRFFHNSPRTHALLHEWWSWPMRLPRHEASGYLHAFPGEQNALNDAILTNSSHLRCVHVTPNRDLYSAPGKYARHFTGVGVNKEKMFFDHWPSDTVEALVRFPSWNDTACHAEQRQVRMPADAHGADVVGVSVELTRHCLASSMVSVALREALWPTRARARTTSAPLLQRL